MRDGLVDYARVSKPLQELLERSLRGTKRSKRAAAGINITLSQEERASFTAVKELLSNSACRHQHHPLTGRAGQFHCGEGTAFELCYAHVSGSQKATVFVFGCQ
ncbi:hypothetical protein PHMEG_00027998 [Phytophthora megakarya]|uniref:Uncharacterized protein n=1 Tax=Phytophthora megakarya TaxID=4795 RepID=A0A225V5X9_9STRA|nr:hypothetical protein PHMEG_00027998 [Phytophthora megakarya]